MKRVLALSAAVILSASTLFAQGQPGGDRGGSGRGGPGSGGGRGGFGGGSFQNPLFEALDANSDGELTADEIAKASEALKKLDKDNNGKISREEVRPAFSGFGGRGGESGGGSSSAGRGGQFNAESMVKSWLEADTNKDGKLDEAELGKMSGGRGDRLMSSGDKNGDKVLDEAEIKAAAEDFVKQFSGGRPGGGRPGGGGQGGGRPAGDGEGSRPATDNN